MKSLTEILNSYSTKTIAILDSTIPMDAYILLDLSKENSDLTGVNIVDPEQCQEYIDKLLLQNAAQVAYGGYLEKRNLYADKANFSGNPTRNIHLGVDFWAKAGTTVLVPIEGLVHSFYNNTTSGDYGPTIILKHEIGSTSFHTLYGHLSLDSLDGLFVGKRYHQGEIIASLGTPDINVDYAPHLHFQVIQDIKGNKGDYPGVCSENELDFYTKNCPDPNLLLKFGLANG